MAADLSTKALAWHLLGPPPDAVPGPPTPAPNACDVLPGWFQFVTSRNPGIIFGIDPARHLGLGPAGAQVATIVLTVLTAALIFYVFATSPRAARWLHVASGLILAGAVGNLYDRIMFGHVRDLMQFTARVAGRAVWPFVFNVADVLLVAGVAAVAYALVFGARPGAPGGDASPRPREGSRGQR